LSEDHQELNGFYFAGKYDEYEVKFLQVDDKKIEERLNNMFVSAFGTPEPETVDDK